MTHSVDIDTDAFEPVGDASRDIAKAVAAEKGREVYRDLIWHYLICAIDDAFRELGPKQTRKIFDEAEKRHASNVVS